MAGASEFFRLKHVLGTDFSIALASPYVTGVLITAISCWVAVTLFFLRRYTLIVWITAVTVAVLLVYRVTVIGW